MFDWNEWDEAAETTVDLSYEANELGLIPLSCPHRFSSSSRACSTKVFDAPQKRRLKGITYRRVQCLLCGYDGWRKIGLKRDKRE